MRLPTSRAHRFALLSAAAGLLLAATSARAQPGSRDLTTVDYGTRFQPPSLRLEAMGGLGLSVRDEYTELNLWDFAGLPFALLEDCDSTRLVLWAQRQGVALDRKEGGIQREVKRDRDVSVAGEGVLRSARTAFGAEFGVLNVQRGLPFADGEHVEQSVSQPAVRPLAAGRLLKGLRWGLSALFGQETSTTEWRGDEVTGGRVELGSKGPQLSAPDLFSPDHARVRVSGATASLGLVNDRWGSLGAYYERRWERSTSSLKATRSLYELSEPRDWTGYGVAVIARPQKKVGVGIIAGRQYYAGTESYRFTQSGGSNANPLLARGKRLHDGGRQDFLQLRIQGDIPRAPLTFGGAVRIAYRRADQSPALDPELQSDFNSFVVLRAAGDTMSAPRLVEDLHQASRVFEWGGGVSYRFLGERATAGVEFHSYRDAVVGTALLRRAKDWDVRAGAQYDIGKRWSALAGYRHGRTDYDTSTLRNENLVDRVSVGAVGQVLRGWRCMGELHKEWHRTDYPDPSELGGSAMGFALQLSRGL